MNLYGRRTPIGLLALLAACSSNSTSPFDAQSDLQLTLLDSGGAADRRIDAPAAARTGPLFRRTARAGELAAFERQEVVVAKDGALELRAGGGISAKDPYAAGSYQGGNYYNGGSYRYGTARSTEWISTKPFDQVIPSFEAETPTGTWVEVRVSARVGTTWSKEYVLGIWASSKETVSRHSVAGQDDSTAAVKTDTLVLFKKASALRLSIQLFSADSVKTPRVRGVAAIVTDSTATPPTDQATPAARGKTLAVPSRSQMVYPKGSVWCSPTSTSMLLGYWSAKLKLPSLDETVPTTADGTYDFVYDGHGNWTFNMAHAASAGGEALHAIVTRLGSFHQVERLVAADVPVAISLSFAAGELTGAPVSSTDGHLIVVRGFTSSGDVVCNDPAFSTDSQVQVTYKRDELERAWAHSRGATYVVWPALTLLPIDPLGAFYP